MENNNSLFESTKQILWSVFDLVKQEAITELAEKYYGEFESNIEEVAALVTVLNHKCWYYYEHNNQILSDLYAELYYKYNDKAWDWLEKYGTDEEKHWYFETMD